MNDALQYAIEVFSALEGFVAAGIDVADLFATAKQKLQEFHDQGRGPSAGEWNDINALIATKRGELHAP